MGSWSLPSASEISGRPLSSAGVATLSETWEGLMKLKSSLPQRADSLPEEKKGITLAEAYRMIQGDIVNTQ